MILRSLMLVAIMGAGCTDALGQRYSLGIANHDIAFSRSSMVWDGRTETIAAFSVPNLSLKAPSRFSNERGQAMEYSVAPGTPFLPPLGYQGVVALLQNFSELDRKMAAGDALTSLTQSSTFLTWLDRVRNRGEWNYKSSLAESRLTFIHDLLLENLGNFNFGATGRYIGLSPEFLNAGAGIVSQRSLGVGVFGGIGSPAWGDDPVDWLYSRLGQTYFDSGQYMKDYFNVLRIQMESDFSKRASLIREFELGRIPANLYLQEAAQAERVKIRLMLDDKEMNDHRTRLEMERYLDSNPNITFPVPK